MKIICAFACLAVLVLTSCAHRNYHSSMAPANAGGTGEAELSGTSSGFDGSPPDYVKVLSAPGPF